MPFVKRDDFGRIVSVHLERTDEGLEELPKTSRDLMQFFIEAGDIINIREYFDRLDKDFVRVIEDVIHLLIERRVIALTDMPLPAQHKLAERRNLRGKKGDLCMIVGNVDDIVYP